MPTETPQVAFESVARSWRANGGDDPNEAPPGYRETRVPTYNPFRYPSDSEIGRKVAKGMVLFRSSFLGLSLPAVAPRTRNLQTGQREVVERGYIISFERGEFWADKDKTFTAMVDGVQKLTNEIEFLRFMARIRPADRIVEITRDMFQSEQVAGIDPKNLVEAFALMSIPELRELFTQEEIEEHKLAKAGHERLIVSAIRTGKTPVIPQGTVVEVDMAMPAALAAPGVVDVPSDADFGPMT